MDLGMSPSFDIRRCFAFFWEFLEAAPRRVGSDLSRLSCFFFPLCPRDGPDYDLNDDAKMYMSKRCFMIRDIGVGIYFSVSSALLGLQAIKEQLGLDWIHGGAID